MKYIAEIHPHKPNKLLSSAQLHFCSQLVSPRSAAAQERKMLTLPGASYFMPQGSLRFPLNLEPVRTFRAVMGVRSAYKAHPTPPNQIHWNRKSIVRSANRHRGPLCASCGLCIRNKPGRVFALKGGRQLNK